MLVEGVCGKVAAVAGFWYLERQELDGWMNVIKVLFVFAGKRKNVKRQLGLKVVRNVAVENELNE